MTYRIEAVSQGVRTPSDGQYQYETSTRDVILVKNVGDVTVYIGSVLKTGSDTISDSSGYPLLPNESMEVPGLASTDTYVLAFNTAAGEGGSTLRILAIQDN
jgi:hypothetical protein